jgi:hypothetical protein
VEALWHPPRVDGGRLGSDDPRPVAGRDGPAVNRSRSHATVGDGPWPGVCRGRCCDNRSTDSFVFRCNRESAGGPTNHGAFDRPDRASAGDVASARAGARARDRPCASRCSSRAGRLDASRLPPVRVGRREAYAVSIDVHQCCSTETSDPDAERAWARSARASEVPGRLNRRQDLSPALAPPDTPARPRRNQLLERRAVDVQ